MKMQTPKQGHPFQAWHKGLTSIVLQETIVL